MTFLIIVGSPILVMLTIVHLYKWKHRYMGKHRAGIEILAPHQGQVWYVRDWDGTPLILTQEQAWVVGQLALDRMADGKVSGIIANGPKRRG